MDWRTLGNRSSLEEDVIGEKVSEDYSKVMDNGFCYEYE